MSDGILIAGKMGAIGRSLAAALKERGYDVLHASTRAEALGHAAEARLVLLDRALTSEGALDVVRELQDRADTRHIPILIHNPKKDVEYERQALEAGAQAVLQRPSDHNALLEQIEKLCPARQERAGPPGRYVEDRNEQQIVRFLAKLLDERIPSVRCQYDPQSPTAYSYPLVEDFFELPSQEAVQLLEDLVAEGLLDRRLRDKVHVCPSCQWHALNFVEVCPHCDSIDIEVEEVIHHFACAYVGPYSEFRRGVDLVCPKCGEPVRHLGQDYEKPSDTYVCRPCAYVFTDSNVQAQCLRCGHGTAVEELDPVRIYEYVPTPKASQAVEYGRLHGLDIRSVLFEDRSRTFRRDFLIFEIDREIYRARRYSSPLSLVLMGVNGVQGASGAKDSVELKRALKEIFEQVNRTLRDLDLVSALSDGCAAILLPETPLEGGLIVAQRVQSMISDFQSVNLRQQVSTTVAAGTLLPEHDSGMEFFDYVHQGFRWAQENRPGQVVSAEVWEGDSSDA